MLWELEWIFELFAFIVFGFEDFFIVVGRIFIVRIELDIEEGVGVDSRFGGFFCSFGVCGGVCFVKLVRYGESFVFLCVVFFVTVWRKFLICGLYYVIGSFYIFSF